MKTLILEKLLSQIKNLDLNQQFQIGIAVLERMFPTYQAFSEEHQFGDTIFLEKSISLLKQQNCSNEEVQMLLDNLDNIMPDTEDFGGYLLCTAAVDTCCVLYELLLWKQNPQIQHLKSIFSLAFNACEMYVTDFVRNAYDHELMQSEIALFEKWIVSIQNQEPIVIPENEWIAKILEVDRN